MSTCSAVEALTRRNLTIVVSGYDHAALRRFLIGVLLIAMVDAGYLWMKRRPPFRTCTSAVVGDAESMEHGESLSGLELVQIAGADRATSAFVADDGDLYFTTRGGEVMRQRGDDAPELLIDLRDRIPPGFEQGLLSVVLSHEMGELFVYFTDLDNSANVVAYPLLNGGAGSETDPRDPGSSENAQRLDVLRGSILRIGPSPTVEHPYQVPPGNPFVDVPDARPEIWLYGVRNPWRFTFDSETGDLWIGDVGQTCWEEVNYLPASEGRGAGANLG